MESDEHPTRRGEFVGFTRLYGRFGLAIFVPSALAGERDEGCRTRRLAAARSTIGANLLTHRYGAPLYSG